MEQHTINNKSNTDISWEGDLSEEKLITKWRDNVTHAALQNLQMEYINTDTTIRINKAFESGLNTSRLDVKSLDGAITGRLEPTEEDVLKHLATEFTFTKISQDVVATFANRDPLRQMHKKSTVASLFNHESMHDLFQRTFYKEELLINGSETADHPEFIFKTYASAKNRFECEQI
jgi:hypothetical protein